MNHKNIREFLESSIKYNNIQEILDNYDNLSMRGFIYERLWDLVIKFNYCDLFKSSDYEHKINNINKGKSKRLINLNTYLDNNISSGNSTGCSDITLYNTKTNQWIFMTCKYLNNTKTTSVKDYDIQNIISMIHDKSPIYDNFKIYLLVKDKEYVLKKMLRSRDSSVYITKYINHENILDINDLNKYFLLLKADLTKHMNSSEIINYNSLYLSKKENLRLRFHQELTKRKLLNQIKQNHRIFL